MSDLRSKAHWTVEEEEWLMYHWRSQKTFAGVLAKHPRSRWACIAKLNEFARQGRINLFPAGKEHSLTRVALLLGIAKKTLNAYNAKGFIRAVRSGATKNRLYFTESEIYRFVEVHFEKVNVPIMPDGKFKRYALEKKKQPDTEDLITVQAAANLKGVSIDAIYLAYKKGILRGEKRQRYLFIHRSSLTRYVPQPRGSVRKAA